MVATLTLLSNEIARKIGKGSMPNLDTMCQNIFDAGGKELNVSGKGTFALKIDSFSCTVQAAVADLMIDGVKDLDFLTGYNCSVVLRKQEITIGDFNKFQMVRKGHFRCFRVVTPSTIRIPAKPEVVVPEKVSTPESEQQSCFKSIIEPTFDKANDMPAVVDRKSVTSTVSTKKLLPNSAQLNTQLVKNRSSVKRHKGQANRRQKRYHDAKVNWQSFKKADKVYVFFL